MKRFYYLITLTFVFCIPTVAAGFFLMDFISIATLIPFILLILVMGSIWDVWATRHGRKDRIWIWHFNHSETLGFKFLGLPIEEYLFYVVSSVYVVFMWEGIKLTTTNNTMMPYVLVISMGVWTLISITIPYLLAPRGDKFIN